MKKTYSLKMLEDTICEDNVEVNAVYDSLKTALAKYQWHYQQASEKKFKTVDDQTSRSIETVLKLLHDQGQDSLIGDLEYALQHHMDKSTLTKSKVLTKAKRVLKSEMTKTIKIKRYENGFAEMMAQAFIEQSNEFPLDKAPDTMDIHFEPDPIYDWK